MEIEHTVKVQLWAISQKQQYRRRSVVAAARQRPIIIIPNSPTTTNASTASYDLQMHLHQKSSYQISDISSPKQIIQIQMYELQLLPSNYSSSYTSPPPNNPIIIIHAQPPVPHPHFSLIWLLLHHTLGPPQLVTHIPLPHIYYKKKSPTMINRCTLPSFSSSSPLPPCCLCSHPPTLQTIKATLRGGCPVATLKGNIICGGKSNHQSHPQGGLPRCNFEGKYNIIEAPLQL